MFCSLSRLPKFWLCSHLWQFWFLWAVSHPWQPIASNTEGFALAPGPTLLTSTTGRRDHSHITTMQPLCHTAPSRVPTTQPRTPQDLTRTNTAAREQQPCSPSWILTKSFVIIASLYLVPFHLCILLFSSQLYHYLVPTLYLSLYLLCLVVWSPDSHFSQYLSLSSIVRSYCMWLACCPGCITSCPALCI